MKQNYENYWKLTVEYSDINGHKFLDTLKKIISFIDINDCSDLKKSYNKLQNEIYDIFPKNDMCSIRKSINQFVKLGFINTHLKSYHNLTLDFLIAKSNRKRKSLFSKIVYSNSSFNSSITQKSSQKEINFLIKTLEETGVLSKEDVIGLMTVDIPTIKKGFLTKKEVDKARGNAKEIGFIKRKHNQISYLWNFLKKLDDLIIKDNVLCFEEDAQVVFGEVLKKETRKRDNYLHRIYKNQLKEEVKEQAGIVKCMIENLSYPSLVASHIKPFIESNEEEAYNPNNGLLLSRNIDILFDQHYISFQENGDIIISKDLNKDVYNYLNSFSLPQKFINIERVGYLKYHRTKLR